MPVAAPAAAVAEETGGGEKGDEKEDEEEEEEGEEEEEPEEEREEDKELGAFPPPFSGNSRSYGCPHTDDMMVIMLAKAAAFSSRTGRSPAASSTPRNSNAREGKY